MTVLNFEQPASSRAPPVMVRKPEEQDKKWIVNRQIR